MSVYQVDSKRGGLDTVVYINCNTKVEVSETRMREREHKLSRLDLINSASELHEVLILQRNQFNKIRKRALKKTITIDMDDSAADNAAKIISELGLEK